MNEIVVGVNESDTELHVVMCVDRGAKSLHVAGETWHVDSVSEAEQYIVGLAGELAPPKVSHTVSFDDPVKALCSIAEERGARMIVVGNRRVQRAGRVLGSVALDVLRKAPCDVLVAHTTA